MIREVEKLSGMTRADIRFYEAEGLLAPERHGNGYRNYSEDDLQVVCSRIGYDDGQRCVEAVPDAGMQCQSLAA